MTKLAQTEWDALSDEDKALRQDEKPDEVQGPTSPTPTVEELGTQVKDLTDKLNNLTQERDGVIGDLRSERELRQSLDATVKQLQQQTAARSDDPLAGKSDEDYLTVADVKKILAQANKTAGESRTQDENATNQRRSQENYAGDESRVTDKKDLEVPYKDAIKEFNTMAKANPALWQTVHLESIRVGGKPAELAYTIALTSPTFVSRIKTKEREALILKLENEGKLPKKLPPGGPGAGPIDASVMSEEQLLNLSDAQLEEQLKKTG